VPKSVVDELDTGRAGGYDVPSVAALSWAEVVSSPTLALLALATDLGKGGVTVTGTLGVLRKAKTAGHIPSVAPMLTRLTALGFHLSAPTRDAVLKLANEV
jgi:hypothetical protein